VRPLTRTVHHVDAPRQLRLHPRDQVVQHTHFVRDRKTVDIRTFERVDHPAKLIEEVASHVVMLPNVRSIDNENEQHVRRKSRRNIAPRPTENQAPTTFLSPSQPSARAN
jgi:hypothetical protein